MPANNWMPLEPDAATMLSADANPIRSLAHGDLSAVIFRQAFPADQCRSLIDHLIDEQLMFDSTNQLVDANALSAGVTDKWTGLNLNPDGSPRRRIDIGTSLGNIGEDQELFLTDSAKTHGLFDRLFAERPDPIRTMYDRLQDVSPGKRVVTAYEPDGRKYGPAIFRIHYGGYTYGPHYDSVRQREKRSNYSIFKYQSQLAGVLCLQNSTLNGVTAQGIIHRQFWNEEVDPYMTSGRFDEYAAEHDVEQAQVELEPGDLYFFNTELIHEVPGVPGELPRVVLAVFIGYNDDDDEVMVWS
jgi:hypothetical protein